MCLSFGRAFLSVKLLDFTGYFWHITDMHWDPTYSTQTKALSCNSGSPSSGYGQFGNHKCDPPMTLINSSVQAMKTIFPDPDYLRWTG